MFVNHPPNNGKTVSYTSWEIFAIMFSTNGAKGKLVDILEQRQKNVSAEQSKNTRLNIFSQENSEETILEKI